MIGYVREVAPGLCYIYDEKGSQIGSCQVASPNDKLPTLVGYTSSTVSLRSNGWIYIFNEQGRQIGCNPA